MKNFMEPEMNVVKFSVEDVITTSGITGGGADGNTGGAGNED